MGKERRIRDFSGCWSEPDLAAYGVWYIKQAGHLDIRSGIGLSLGVVFGPMGRALLEEDPTAVEKAVVLSRSTYEGYMHNALSFVGSSNGLWMPQSPAPVMDSPEKVPEIQATDIDYDPDADRETPMNLGDD